MEPQPLQMNLLQTPDRTCVTIIVRSDQAIPPPMLIQSVRKFLTMLEGGLKPVSPIIAPPSHL